MRIGVKSHVGELITLENALADVSGPEQIRREAEASVPMVESLYILGFERTESPMGEKWAPPKHDYGHPLMRDTRALQQGATVLPLRDGVAMRVSVEGDYDVYHQNGTEKMVARKIVPDTHLGPTWERKIGEARAAVKPRLP